MIHPKEDLKKMKNILYLHSADEAAVAWWHHFAATGYHKKY